MIICDTREASKQEKILKFLRSLGVEIKIDKLEIGDYYICGSRPILVERKRIFDLVNSVRTGRLWSQLRMLKNIENVTPLLLIESSPSLPVKRGKWKEVSVASILNSIVLDWRVQYVYSPSWRWTCFILKSLCNFTEMKAEYHKLQYDRKPQSLDEAVLFLTESIPYVGPVHARELLKKFGTFEGIVKASKEELMEINGISETRAQYIWSLFRHSPKIDIV